jgi:uncharacterized FlgJ-related protein
MALHNLGKNHLVAAEKTQVTTLLGQMEQALAGKITDLSAEDRKKYGSINEQNKLFVNKVMDYHSTQPQHSAPEIDWTEFSADYESRKFWEGVALRLSSLVRQIESTKILHDYDNYQDSLADYSYTQYRSARNIPGAADKEEALKQFFPRTASEKPIDAPPITDVAA